jgi:hypothetical protein
VWPPQSGTLYPAPVWNKTTPSFSPQVELRTQSCQGRLGINLKENMENNTRDISVCFLQVARGVVLLVDIREGAVS